MRVFFSSTFLSKSLQKKKEIQNATTEISIPNCYVTHLTTLQQPWPTLLLVVGRFLAMPRKNLKTVIWSIAVKQPKITMAVPEDAAYQEKRG